MVWYGPEEQRTSQTGRPAISLSIRCTRSFGLSDVLPNRLIVLSSPLLKSSVRDLLASCSPVGYAHLLATSDSLTQGD